MRKARINIGSQTINNHGYTVKCSSDKILGDIIEICSVEPFYYFQYMNDS